MLFIYTPSSHLPGSRIVNGLHVTEVAPTLPGALGGGGRDAGEPEIMGLPVIYYVLC